MKIDLHNHTSYSYDGKTTKEELFKYSGDIDIVAITDHNVFGFHQNNKAEPMNRTYNIGKLTIIPGEEIMTSNGGEVIGLFLKKEIAMNKSFFDTIREIKNQGGLVYIPHPFDVYRRKSRPNMKLVKKHINDIDIIEINNGKYLLFESKRAIRFARNNNKLIGVGSDAHNINSLGKTYLEYSGNIMINTPSDLLEILRSNPDVKYHKKNTLQRIFKFIVKRIKRK